jgi:hypothetical protein
VVLYCVFLIVTNVYTGLSLYDISFSYRKAGDWHRAIECAREALRIWQATLPQGHEDIVDAQKRVLRLEQAMQ